MSENDRLLAYIDSLNAGNTPFLDRIEEEALKDSVPVIRRPTQSLIRFLLQMHKPEQILEVGTAVGFSAILMATYGPPDCRITTIEKYEKRFPVAERNFAESGFADRIDLQKGDAEEILPALAAQGKQYDMIFMDAAKGQYLHFYEQILPMMHTGSLLISDNVLQEGDIAQSRFAVTRRNRTIHARMREYLYTLTHSQELVTDILPVGDGIALSIRR
ncbi:MAG: O-methyltransferase [Lachnospiraceae bacterium]|nr:O-methyltransferase [Lachnospiraceae bacterium]